jgi:hypothetical protein
MAGLYDRLIDQIGDDDDDDKPTGLTPFDLVDLPDTERQIMLFLLREQSASIHGLSYEIMEQNLKNIENLPTAVAELTKQSWLIKLGEPPNIRYKVNLRRKPGTKHRSSIWTAITDHLMDEGDTP